MKKYKICIVGSGSRYTPGILEMLYGAKERFPIDTLVMYDNDQERLDLMGQYAEIFFQEYYPDCKIVYTMEPKEAFENIDFAFMQIRAGRLPMREQDEKIAIRNGCIGQETCGPGGFAYGMRSIPAVCAIIKDIRTYSPNAWILNYSNPAAIVAEATKRVFPKDKRIINICDMPIGIMDFYAKLLKMEASALEPRYFGLNHFGWFTHIYDKQTGEDYLPRIKKLLETPVFENEAIQDKLANLKHAIDPSWIETFNFMSIMSKDDPEYLLNTYFQYYLYPKHIYSLENPEHTRANEVMEGHEKRTYERLRKVVTLGKLRGSEYEPKNLGIDGHAEYIVDLAYALSNNTKEVFLCMIENDGIIENMSEGAMVEVPCIATSNGLEALHVGTIPTFQKGLMENQFAYEKLTVDACLEGNYHKALQALTLNRCVNDLPTARKLLDEYIEVNKEYWPELK